MRDPAAEDIAGTILANWAVREAVLREEAATDWPTHVQYGGAGRIVIQPDGREVVWPPGLRGMPP